LGRMFLRGNICLVKQVACDPSNLEPFCNEAQDALVRDAVLEETDDPRVGHGIEKAPDIRV
jgi:hypothetical protein